MPDREDLYEKLKETLLEIRIPHPKYSQPLSYAEYLALSQEVRGDDERDVVDRILTTKILECLGYNASDWHYNRAKGIDRPDFVIRPGGKTAFFWENKRTSLDLDPESEQVSRYAESIAPMGILFNGKEIVAFRREQGRPFLLLHVDLLQAYEEFGAPVLDFLRQEAREKVELFYELFRKERFADFSRKLQGILISDEANWKKQARSIQTYLETFIDEIQGVIERLAHMAYSFLEISDKKIRDYKVRLQDLQDQWNKHLAQIPQDDLVPRVNLQDFLANGQKLAYNLGEVQDQDFQTIASQLRNRPSKARLIERLRQLNNKARELGMLYESYRELHARYMHWVELQRRFEEGAGLPEEGKEEQELDFNRRKRFARQCAYVFFLKLLLVRILEDKGIIKPRLISDGGLEAWVTAVRPRFAVEEGRFSAAHLLRMALERAAGHYSELVQREVYDWFIPDDLSILDTLEVLASYDFSALSTDLIGYTYQRFLERTERRRLGHYLTPPEVVDYILDEAKYTHDNSEILGKKVLDPACGSGSFLVHAAYRYRQALKTYYQKQLGDDETARLNLAQGFLQSIQENFVGMDLNPFSCYLARINLLIQALDDYYYLYLQGQEVSIKGFRIYNTDSLVNYAQGTNLLEEVDENTVAHLKLKEGGKFGFVFANPPYITPKQENVGIASLREDTFYESWLSGDINTYIFFIRVGLHFLSPGGRLAYIVPLTSLGDQQSEALRRKLLSLTKPLAITRFYTEHVLFKGVNQAVVILVLEKDATEAKDSLEIRIRGGGYGQTPGEAIQDTRARPTLVIPFRELSWWISKGSKPRPGLKVPNQRESWENVWSVLPENRDYYRLWEHMVSTSSKTLYKLFEELGLRPPENFISQGDVNTTHVKPFHVSENDSGAMPLYKGETIDLLMPLPYPPERGPRGRDPFVAPLDQHDQLSSDQQRALSELQRIAQLREAEHGFVLHETANIYIKRRLKGTIFKRDEKSKAVFTHKLWVFRIPKPELAKALLGLLVSTPLNFAYSALSTNNSIATRVLFSLPVPDDFDGVASALRRHVEDAIKAGERLQSLLKDYGGRLSIEASYTNGKVELDPITLLQREQLADVKMEHYRQRGYIKLAAENFKLQTLWERGKLKIEEHPKHLQDIIQLWIERYGDHKWDEFKELCVPDDPDAFWKQWTKKCKEAQSYLQDYFKAIATIDEIVADWYKIPTELRPLLQEKLPWTHGADQEEEEEP
jgi:type I restriction-modification system DNA methylase subunit